MGTKNRATQSEIGQQIINDWMNETGNEIIDMIAVAKWAIANGRWRAPRFDPAKICARFLSRSAREEFYTDPQQRNVRKKHCYTVLDENGQYKWLWFDIVNAQTEQMHKSAQARRRMALGDVAQLSTDISSFNDNNKYGGHIDMSFNFDEDLAEMSHPTEYPGDEDIEGEEDESED
jgi:hypothetical protein